MRREAAGDEAGPDISLSLCYHRHALLNRIKEDGAKLTTDVRRLIEECNLVHPCIRKQNARSAAFIGFIIQECDVHFVLNDLINASEI